MQTFLPYPNYVRSAQVLDNRRLGKQRVEALQIIKALILPDYGWRNHPAVKMWKNNIESLKVYHDVMIEEWKSRGFKNSMPLFFPPVGLPTEFPDCPGWLGDEAFHASHRSNLLRKDPIHYGKFGWAEPNNLPYIWPTKEFTNVQPHTNIA